MINEISLFIKKFVTKNKLNIDSVYLYGSLATGDFTKDSDVDLYVFTENIEEAIKLKLALEEKFKRTFFVNVFSFKELKYLLKENLFKHRDRTSIFLYEFLTNKFRRIYGKNIVNELYHFLPFYEDLDLEIIKNIYLFKYLSKKFFVNPNNTKNLIAKYIKFSAKLFDLFYHRNFYSYKQSIKKMVN